MFYTQFQQEQVRIPEGVKKIYEGIIKDGRSLVINDLSCDSDLVPIGSLYIDKTSQHFYVKKANGRSSILPSDIFDEGVFTDTMIGKNSVDGNRLKPRTVYNTRIAYQTITDSEIKDQGISGVKIKPASISDLHLLNGIIKNQHLTTACVSATNIANASIESAHLKSAIVGNVNLKPDCVSEINLKMDAVQKVHIADKAIISEKIEDDAIVSRHIQNSQIQTNHIIDKNITTEKIADLSINQEKIKDKSINEFKIDNLAIKSNHIATEQIALPHLQKDIQQKITNSMQIIAGTGKATNLVISDGITTGYFVTKNIISDIGTFKSHLYVGGNLETQGDVIAKGKVYHAVYNDLAEAYVPGENLTPGLCVAIHADGKIYKANPNECIVGVISEDYATCYGATYEELCSGAKVAVGLIGKVPVMISGELLLGQYIEVDKNGYCKATDNKLNAIGKALENKKTNAETVLCLIFPN